ncbi:carbohydrate binding domain-containing protein [Streptomyces niger]|uniref:carbohydrate binding domain-containing protein n=1 Tax=Streptomyces niger TaxID=66373 RepID=UPI00069B9FA2|nr:carbohydrate binding domain-containing protein [Streptomyces niger]
MAPHRGVYFLANDGFLDYATAFLNSFRRYNPTLPLCLIPFADDIGTLCSLRSSYAFSVLDDDEVLRACDTVGRALRGAQRGHFRKLAMWEGPFDEFAYFDSDTVVLHSADFVFDLLADHGFLTAHGNDPDTRRFVWNDSIEATGRLTEEQISFAGATGFLASRKECLSLADVIGRLPEIGELAPHMCPGLNDQPALNYLMVTSGYRYASLHGLAQAGATGLPVEWWGGDPVDGVEDGRVTRSDDHPPFFVHWSGPLKQATAPLVNRALWEAYRDDATPDAHQASRAAAAETAVEVAVGVPTTTDAPITCSFEDGTAQGWSCRIGGARVTVSDTVAHSGAHSLLCSSRAEPWEGPRLPLPAPPTPGSTYTFRLWARLAPGEAPAALKLTVERHASGSVCYDTVVPDTPVTAGSWVELGGAYTLTHEATRLVLYAETLDGTAPFHIDDFTMTVRGPATASANHASPYGLTSVTDGELIRTVLLNAAALRDGEPLRVLEWGAGRSTLALPQLLAEAGVACHWTSLEHHRGYLDTELLPHLTARPGATVRYMEDEPVTDIEAATDGVRIDVRCWDRGPLHPHFGISHHADRAADLDDYVSHPAKLSGTPGEYDVFLVDGRKRRRCLLTARQLLGDRTAVLLHDAGRPYYHCALDTYPAGRFIGDELWIGAEDQRLLTELLRRRRRCHESLFHGARP